VAKCAKFSLELKKLPRGDELLASDQSGSIYSSLHKHLSRVVKIRGRHHTFIFCYGFRPSSNSQGAFLLFVARLNFWSF